MLLQVVPDAGNVGRDLDTAGKAHTSDLSKRRVRLLWSSCVDTSTDPTALWASFERRGLVLRDLVLSALADQLLDGGHRVADTYEGYWLAIAIARNFVLSSVLSLFVLLVIATFEPFSHPNFSDPRARACRGCEAHKAPTVETGHSTFWSKPLPHEMSAAHWPDRQLLTAVRTRT